MSIEIKDSGWSEENEKFVVFFFFVVVVVVHVKEEEKMKSGCDGERQLEWRNVSATSVRRHHFTCLGPDFSGLGLVTFFLDLFPF